MMNKQLTDEEIIKALECCKNCCCKQCDKEPDFQKAINLINRQKAEIERLRKEVNLVSIQFQDLQERTDEIKVETYKEFAERLKEKLGDCHIVSDGEYCGFDCGDVHESINNLLKKMVGEDE